MTYKLSSYEMGMTEPDFGDVVGNWDGSGPGCGCGCARRPLGDFDQAQRRRRRGPRFRMECAPGCAPFSAAACRRTLRRDIVRAIRYCRRAAALLEANPREARTIRIFRFFLGHNPSRPVPWAKGKQSGLVVAHRLRKAAGALSRRGMTYACLASCPSPTTNARTNGTVNPSRIELCPRFWTQRAHIRSGILIHETLHLLYTSFFHHSGHPSGDPERRRDNAHCYEALVLRLNRRSADASDVAACRARPA